MGVRGRVGVCVCVCVCVPVAILAQVKRRAATRRCGVLLAKIIRSCFRSSTPRRPGDPSSLLRSACWVLPNRRQQFLPRAAMGRRSRQRPDDQQLDGPPQPAQPQRQASSQGKGRWGGLALKGQGQNPGQGKSAGIDQGPQTQQRWGNRGGAINPTPQRQPYWHCPLCSCCQNWASNPRCHTCNAARPNGHAPLNPGQRPAATSAIFSLSKLRLSSSSHSSRRDSKRTPSRDRSLPRPPRRAVPVSRTRWTTRFPP